LNQRIVDGLLVNGTAKAARAAGWLGSRLQTGEVGAYVVLFVLGVWAVMWRRYASHVQPWVVTALLLWPALAALVVLLAPARWAKHWALVASLIEFAISAPLWWVFVPAGASVHPRRA